MVLSRFELRALQAQPEQRRGLRGNVDGNVSILKSRTPGPLSNSSFSFRAVPRSASDQKLHAPAGPRLTQPQAMKTKTYVYGVEKLNGNEAWSLFEACAVGDVP
jgi:hypothetical protein